MTQGTPPARTDGSKLPSFDSTVPNPARMWNYWLVPINQWALTGHIDATTGALVGYSAIARKR